MTFKEVNMTTRKRVRESRLNKTLLRKSGIFPARYEEHFCDFLNTDLNKVVIFDLEYGAGEVLKEIDPVAFRTAMNDYLDCLKRDGDILEVSGYLYWKHEIEEHFEIIKPRYKR